MEKFLNVLPWVILGIIVVVVLTILIVFIVKIAKMTTEERKEILVTYLKGFVAKAELVVGSGCGEEKLAAVEAYFYGKAPTGMKVVLLFVGKENLKELIELALEELKESFDTTTEVEATEEVEG